MSNKPNSKRWLLLSAFAVILVVLCFLAAVSLLPSKAQIFEATSPSRQEVHRDNALAQGVATKKITSSSGVAAKVSSAPRATSVEPKNDSAMIGHLMNLLEEDPRD